MSTPRAQVEAMSLEDLLCRLERVRRSGEGRWMARCPAHGDKGPSLSIRAGDDGRILLHCFGGCDFAAITAALGVEPRQLFPRSDTTPWKPRAPRPDPEREVRAFFERLCNLRRPPDSQRAKVELEFIGSILAHGSRGFAKLPADFKADSIRWFILRLIFCAVQELARQGTPRRWFSVRALERIIDDAYQEPGHARRIGLYGWCRMAFRVARSVDGTKEEARHA